MLIKIVSILIFCIFTTLSAFHFYWFFGGKWGLDKVIPSKSKTAPSLRIPKFATLIVALALLSFGIFYLVKSDLINFSLPNILYKILSWFIPVIFLIRAIGEFKYVGLFKKVKDTEFAKADSKLFSPLCLSISTLGFIIKFLSQ